LGGVIYNTNGTVIIFGCTVNSNLSGSVCEPSGGLLGGTGLTMGGAVFQASGFIGVTNSSFTMNYAIGGTGSFGQLITRVPGSPAYGGALAVKGGGISIEGSQFLQNQADGAQGVLGTEGGGAGPAYGGAIYCTANCSASDSSFGWNQALAGNFNSWGPAYQGFGGGGGIFNAGILMLNRCSIYNNIAHGGQVSTASVTDAGGALGGGIYNAAQLAATNCTIALNSAVGAIATKLGGPGLAVSGSAVGGGICNGSNGTAICMNLTIASNSCSSPTFTNSSGMTTSSSGLAAGSQIANTNGTLSVHNTLIAYGTNSNAYGQISDGGYNICSDGSAALFSGSSYNYTDPQLAPLGNYGGPTLCMNLLSTSSAIDNGDANGCPNTDQRGYIRPFGGGPDMGAVEFGSAASTVPVLNLSVTLSNVTLSYSAFTTGVHYYVQCSTNLTSWANVSTNGPYGTSTYVSQTMNKPYQGRCFFRLLMQ
jgi:hypothetical protein